MAIAQADVRAYGAEVRKLATELRTAGDDAKAGLQSQLLQAAEHFERAGAAAAGFRGQLAPIKEHAHESESALGGLKERVLEVAAVFGVGFGLERIVEGFVQLAEKAEHMENIAASIGVGTVEFSKISGAIQITTGHADVAARAFQILERNIRMALENPTGTQGRAFEALKVSANELGDGLKNLPEFLDVLANRWERFVTNSDTPGAGIGFFRDALGRDLSEIVPALARGADHFRELKKEAGELSGFTEENIKHLAETAEEINKLDIVWTGMKVAIYESFRDPINESIGAVKELLKDSRDVVSTINEALTLRSTYSKAAIGAAVGGVVGGVPGAVVGGTAGAIVGFGEDLERQSPEEAAKGAVRVPENIERRLAGGASAPLPPREGIGVFNPTEAERAFLDKAKQRESGGDYSLLHGPERRHLSDLSHFPEWEGFMGPKGISHAAGGYGFQPSTYREMAAKTGRSDFSPESQDINALELYREKGTASWPWAGKGGGEGGKERAEAPNYKEIEKHYADEVKGIDERRKALMDYYDQEIKGARDNQDKIRIIEGQKDAAEKQIVAERVKAREDALTKGAEKATPGSLGLKDLTDKIAGPGTDAKDSDEQIKIATGAQERERRAQEEAARLDISKQETQRKIADTQEQTDLRRVEGQRRTGDLTIDAASDAEQKIVQDHAAAVDKILAKEAELAQGSIRSAQEVANRKEEIEAKNAEKITQIQDKAKEEHAARAHAIDAELAGAASGLIVNLATGKGGGIEKQLASFAEGQAKKGLDAIGTKLLDASGVGKLFEGVGDKLFSFLPGAAASGVTGAASGAAANAPVVGAITAQTGTLAGAITAGSATIVGAITAQTATTTATDVADTASIDAAVYAGAALDFAKPEVLGTSLLGGGVIPSAAGGMTVNDGKGGTIAIVHPNEMVLPAPLSLGIQNAISRGTGWSIPAAPAPNTVSPAMAAGGQGGDTHITHNWDIDGVLSTHDFQRLLMAHSDTIAKAGARASRNFSPNAQPR